MAPNPASTSRRELQPHTGSLPKLWPRYRSPDPGNIIPPYATHIAMVKIPIASPGRRSQVARELRVGGAARGDCVFSMLGEGVDS